MFSFVQHLGCTSPGGLFQQAFLLGHFLQLPEHFNRSSSWYEHLGQRKSAGGGPV